MAVEDLSHLPHCAEHFGQACHCCDSRCIGVRSRIHLAVDYAQVVVMGPYDDVTVAWYASASGQHSYHIVTIQAGSYVESMCP